MVKSVAAPQAKGKSAEDKIFGANNRAVALTEKLGADKVINGTVGSMLDEDGNLIMLDVVQKAYKALTPKEIVAYAPIQGYPDYLEAAIDQCFGESRPEGYIRACATSGGSGVLHHVIHNYSEWGDEVLTSDWHWGAYGSMCNDNGRKLREFELLTPDGHFNMESFKANVSDMVAKQYNTVIIMNSPANNPTGFALSDAEWADVLEVCRLHEKNGKRISILVDIAYIAYAGEKDRVRSFMRQFAGLPEHIFTMFAFSMSKGYTMYGQRAGALVGLSSSKAVIEEFANLGKYSARTAWSNINRAAMTLLTKIRSDRDLMAQLELERMSFAKSLRRRADIFTYEADRCGLPYVPYKGGFFISIPTQQSAAVCQALEADLVFAGPLAQGVRLGVCSIPAYKMTGVAAKIKKALESVEG